MDPRGLFFEVLTASVVASAIAAVIWIFSGLGSKVITRTWSHRLWWVFLARLAFPLIAAVAYFVIWSLGGTSPGNERPPALVQVEMPSGVDYTSMYQHINSVNSIPNYAGTAVVKTPESNQFNIFPQFFLPKELATTLSYIWIMGLLVATALVLVTVGGVNRKLRSSIAVIDGPLYERFMRYKFRLLPRAKIGLRLSTTLPGPAVYGLFHPIICLPKFLVQKLDPLSLDHIFEHELTHIKRGDQFINALLMVIRIVYWFNPFVWVACRHIDRLRELACDEAVVSTQTASERFAYGQTLILVASLSGKSRLGAAILAMAHGKSEIRQRILKIGQPTKPHWLGFLLAILCIALATGGALLHTTEPIIDAKQRSFLPAVFVPGGSLIVGSKEVKLSSFFMGQTEVTQKQFEIIMNKNPSWFARIANPENRPVEEVSWFDAVQFCNKLSQLDGLEMVYELKGGEVNTDFSKNGWRLPTEAEWQYGAQGGSTTIQSQWAGGAQIDEVAWYDRNSGGVPQPVATKLKNELGLYDMSGNVYEWCNDFYGNYPSAVQDPKGKDSGYERVMKGGGAGFSAFSASIIDRLGYAPSLKSYNAGFRVVRRS